MTFLGVIVGAFKGIFVNLILTGNDRFHPLELCYKIAPFCLLQCLLFSWLQGELALFNQFYSLQLVHRTLSVALFFLGINGLSAFALNCSSFYLTKLTSPLTMSVVGNIKQSISIAFGIVIFSTPIILIDIFGIIMTSMGGFMYR